MDRAMQIFMHKCVLWTEKRGLSYLKKNIHKIALFWISEDYSQQRFQRTERWSSFDLSAMDTFAEV